MVLSTVLAYHQLGFSNLFFKYSIYFFFTITLFFIDYETYLLPDILTIPTIILGLFFSSNILMEHFFAATLGAGILLFIRCVANFAYKTDTMGLGDVKLIAGMGSFWGIQHVLLTLYLSFILGGLAAILLIVIRKKHRRDHIPFGPVIILSSFLALIFEKNIINFLLCNV
jgi:leader peptidase (prepilin peptidase)/N-methyltransferase